MSPSNNDYVFKKANTTANATMAATGRNLLAKRRASKDTENSVASDKEEPIPSKKIERTGSEEEMK